MGWPPSGDLLVSRPDANFPTVRTEMEGVGGVILVSLLVMLAICALAVYIEVRLWSGLSYSRLSRARAMVPSRVATRSLACEGS